MGYAPTKDDYIYMVAWDSAGVIKIGSSARQRWRSFVIRGGRLVWLGLSGFMKYDYPGEYDYQRAAMSFADCAFKTRQQAEPFLGNRGGGWLECYRLDSPAEHFRASCLSIVLEQTGLASPPRIKPYGRAGGMPKYMPRTYAEDERTYADMDQLR